METDESVNAYKDAKLFLPKIRRFGAVLMIYLWIFMLGMLAGGAL